jgi:hypothetical protein
VALYLAIAWNLNWKLSLQLLACMGAMQDVEMTGIEVMDPSGKLYTVAHWDPSLHRRSSQHFALPSCSSSCWPVRAACSKHAHASANYRDSAVGDNVVVNSAGSEKRMGS